MRRQRCRVDEGDKSWRAATATQAPCSIAFDSKALRARGARADVNVSDATRVDGATSRRVQRARWKRNEHVTPTAFRLEVPRFDVPRISTYHLDQKMTLRDVEPSMIDVADKRSALFVSVTLSRTRCNDTARWRVVGM